MVRALVLQHGTVPAGMIEGLSKHELDFSRAYSSNLGRYTRLFPRLAFAQTQPPKELFIEVRCVKDCGIVMTENGELALTENSFHFVKRADVEHLVKQGFLIIK